MSLIDWGVLALTLLVIIAYGIYKTRAKSSLDGYLRDGKSAKWWTVGLSVMATQASAVTFLSTPGQAYDDGMRFVQFYFGLPIAIIIICITFIPRYSKLNVYTAYEYLESRFNLETRLLTAFLFLLQRGLAAGITIYAPAIVLSTVLGTSLSLMIFVIGGLVILYTVLGGTAAVNITQKYQMLIIFLGLFIAFGIIVSRLPDGVSFIDSLHIAGAAGKMNILDFSLNLNDRYTFWTGIIGGSFLALSYFGTDQSQVQRYLTGKSEKESQWGLLFNALFKVPMQFFILLVGIMVFVFYQFNDSPIFFNTQAQEQVYTTIQAESYRALESELNELQEQKRDIYTEGLTKTELAEQIRPLHDQERRLRLEAKEIIKTAVPDAEPNDKDFVFIHFILENLPIGLIGLLLAVFFSAAFSSTASELNALASTSLIDVYKRLFRQEADDDHYVRVAKVLTILWGVVAITFASVAPLFENLIQFVNIIGSLFYGTILGIFLLAFYSKGYISGRSVLISAVISEIIVFVVWRSDILAFLWLNVVGCISVIALGYVIQLLLPTKSAMS
ncbi:MAG: sodium:solute symporter [Bacteroidota bacterium]